jgi:hypothetical protein
MAPAQSLAAVGVLALLAGVPGARDQATPARRAVPLDPVAAIIDAFSTHPLVCLGDAHGDRLGDAFRLKLIEDPRIADLVENVVIETGNVRYQDRVDRFVNGENVDQQAIEQVWLDTAVPQSASREIPSVVLAVRRLNATRPRHMRVLVGEPPIPWVTLETEEQLRTWQAQPQFSSEAFAADLIRREVLAKKQRALVFYGAGHFFRHPHSQSIVTLLEAAQAKTLTIWTNAGAELSSLQPDVAGWPAPSVARLRGTTLGRVGMSVFLGPNAGDVSPEWLVPIEEQFDAVLYLGPLSAMAFDRPTPWPCADPAFGEHLRRLALRNQADADRAKLRCKK